MSIAILCMYECVITSYCCIVVAFALFENKKGDVVFANINLGDVDCFLVCLLFVFMAQ